MAEEPPPTDDSVLINQHSNAPRLTVVSHTYHHLPGTGTSGPEATRFYRWLNSDEEAYERNVKIGTEWATLDVGWLKDKPVACVIIRNVNRRVPNKKPTQQELDALNARVLEVGIEDIHNGEIKILNEIPVNEDMRLSNPKMLEYMRIRCKSGDTKYSIYLVPA